MSSKLLNATIYTFLYVFLIVASVASGAHFAANHVAQLGSTSSAIVSQVGVQRNTIVPLVIDQVIKSSDPKQAATIAKNRKQITEAISSLLADPELSGALAQAVSPIGMALTNGQKSATIDISKLISLIAKKVNTSAGSTVISARDLATIKKSQKIDLTKSAKAYHAVNSIISSFLLAWAGVVFFLVLLFWRRRKIALKTLSILLMTQGIPILALWEFAPKVAIHFVTSNNNSQLAAALFPIAYREVTGFTEILGIIYLLLAVLLYAGYRFTKPKAVLT